MDPLVIHDTLSLPPADFTWDAARAGGPGGQNVNKVSSKVALRFNLPGTAALADDVKERLQKLARNRLDADGWVLITSQRTRDQSRNLEDARQRLRLLVLAALEVPKARKPMKLPRAVKTRRIANKRHDAERRRERAVPGRED